MPTVDSPTDVRHVVDPTWHEVSLVTLNKPLSWTPLRPFIIECELSNRSDKVFVRQLFDNLRQGCMIGYTGSHFSYLASNLESAFEHPDVIDATLKNECEARRILGPFDQPPLPNFCTSGLGLVPKHDGMTDYLSLICTSCSKHQ